jgi:hypothetical protein
LPASPLQEATKAGKKEDVSKYWRDEVAAQLVHAAEELRSRRDGSFIKSFTVALGYLEHASRMKLSRNAERLWEAVCQTVRVGEHTAQMKLTPEAMENIARMRASDPDIAPPSLPISVAPRKSDE